MNVFVVSLLAVPLLMLTGCGEEALNDKSKTEAPMMLMDEFTSIDELPSVLEEGLTPEEKAELREKILPSGSADELAAEEKFRQLLEEARTGDAKAQNGLGVMYYTGEAISKNGAGQILENDPELAAGWFFRAAEQGYADAQFNLGLMYANGEGVSQDTAKAVELFQNAADQGHVDAQNNLGALYYTGEGIARDVDEAIHWFEKAAAQGNLDAQANLDAIRSMNN